MKNIYILLFTLGISLVSYAQNVKSTAYENMLKNLLSHTVPEINVEEIKVNEATESIFFLDAREKKEYVASHIKGAIWTGYDTFKMSSVKSIPKDAKIIIYCSVGYRSEKISEKLIKAGYKDVSNLYGGLFEWSNHQRPLVDSNNESTKKIHAYNKKWGQWIDKGEKVYN